MKSTAIKYPYIPTDVTFGYVPASHFAMIAARAYALTHSLDDAVKTGAVVVKDGTIIGRAANGSDYHKTHICERVRLRIPTGQGYELCEGCHPKNHAEPRAIANVRTNGFDPRGSDLYLWGHWWACEDCWKTIKDAGIARVYLLEGSEYLFNKADARNILGRWHE